MRRLGFTPPKTKTMDSTPTPISQHSTIKASARKLPIKRKTPDLSPPNPNPNPAAVLPTTEFSGDGGEDDDDIDAADRGLPPFKFHRIWTESDEIRFLQGLLDCSAEGLVFPRDLHFFFARFSEPMTQPYTKSQLSEKLRRLRKKFRVISARLARGLEVSSLSLHDRASFEISKKLWHPEFESGSPFGKISNDNGENKKRISIRSDGGSNLVKVKVSFSPTLPFSSSDLHQTPSSSEANCINHMDDDDDDSDDPDPDADADADADGDGDDNNKEANFEDFDCDSSEMNEVKIDYDFGIRQDVLLESNSCLSGGDGNVIEKVAAKSIVDVFDESVEEVRTMLSGQGLPHPPAGSSSSSSMDFEKRWREQRIAELDVLSRRLRLVVEDSIHGLL